MRLERITLRGLTRFTGEVTLDYGAYGRGLIALVGLNGAGKTTALEAAAAALYKSFPSRPGSLYEYAAPGAFIDATFLETDGKRVRTHLAIDPEGRKTEGYVYIDGVAVADRDVLFRETVDYNFGSEALFLSSVFAAQNKAGNFLLATRAQRKTLFAELLNLRNYEVMHETAKKNRDQLAGIASKLDELISSTEYEIRSAAPTAQAEHERAQGAEADIQLSLDEAQEMVLKATEALNDARARAERVADKRRAMEQAHADDLQASRDIEAARKEAQTAAQGLQRIIDGVLARDAAGKIEGARGGHASRMGVLNTELRQARVLAARGVTTREAIAQIDGLTKRRDVVLALYQKETEANNALALRAADARAAQRAVDADVERYNAAGRRGALIGRVPCHDQAPLVASCPLLEEAREAAKVRPDLALGIAAVATEQALVRATAEHKQAAEAVGIAESLSEIEDALADLVKEREQLPKIIAAEERAKQTEANIAQAETDHKERLEHLTIEASLDANEVARVRREMATAVIRDAKKLVDLEQRRDAARVRIEKTEAAFRAGNEGPSVVEAEEALRISTDTAKTLGVEHTTAMKRSAAAHAAVTVLIERVEKLTPWKGELEEHRRDLSDWMILEQAFSRDGIPALEMDAAGPEVAALANNLLEACYNSRFVIAFETLREKKAARGTFTETFDVKVYDAGVERQVEALSGGERVVIGEAVGLAIAIFNSRRAGVRWETLFRDETAGALDPENAQAYVDMLRRALDLGGFYQCIFVAHQPEVYERADVRLLVGGGHVTVDGANEEVPEPVI